MTDPGRPMLPGGLVGDRRLRSRVERVNTRLYRLAAESEFYGETGVSGCE